MAGAAAAAPISDDEPITRYITDRDYLRDGDEPYVYWRAFRPRPADQDLSIARVSGLAADAIWTLGDAFAGAGGRTVYGRADFVSPDVVAARANGAHLTVTPAEPPPRHAAIVGWPNDPNARRALAMAVAAAAAAVRAPHE